MHVFERLWIERCVRLIICRIRANWEVWAWPPPFIVSQPIEAPTAPACPVALKQRDGLPYYALVTANPLHPLSLSLKYSSKVPAIVPHT